MNPSHPTALEEPEMSVTITTSAPTTTTTTTSTRPKRTFKRRYTVAHGNAIQAAGMAGGAGLLAIASGISGTGIIRTGLMLAGFIAVYLNCHSIAHYAAGRLVGLKFRGYGVRGTDHPEVYPPGVRQLMQAAPFYVTLSTKASRERAGPLAKAVYFAAGETSTAICSIAFAAAAAAAHIPGGQMLLMAMIGFNAISTVVTTRNPNGDYGKALRALRG
jgi:hypothetical protein